MASEALPTRNDLGRYVFQVPLDETVFGFDFRFNVRDNRWYYDLLDADGVALRHGIKIVSNWPTLGRMAQQTRPDGGIVAVRADGDDDPDRETLGNEVILCFVTS